MNIELRDYLAGQAMEAVMQETQEMRVASFWDWCKEQMVKYLNFTFLYVRYVPVPNVYKEAAQRAYEYADAMLLVKHNRL